MCLYAPSEEILKSYLQNKISEDTRIIVAGHGYYDDSEERFKMGVFRDKETVIDPLFQIIKEAANTTPVVVDIHSCSCEHVKPEVSILPPGSLVFTHGGVNSENYVTSMSLIEEAMKLEPTNLVKEVIKTLPIESTHPLRMCFSTNNESPAIITLPGLPIKTIRSDDQINSYFNLLIASLYMELDTLRKEGKLPLHISLDIPYKIKENIDKITSTSPPPHSITDAIKLSPSEIETLKKGVILNAIVNKSTEDALEAIGNFSSVPFLEALASAAVMNNVPLSKALIEKAGRKKGWFDQSLGELVSVIEDKESLETVKTIYKEALFPFISNIERTSCIKKVCDPSKHLDKPIDALSFVVGMTNPLDYWKLTIAEIKKHPIPHLDAVYIFMKGIFMQNKGTPRHAGNPILMALFDSPLILAGALKAAKDTGRLSEIINQKDSHSDSIIFEAIAHYPEVVKQLCEAGINLETTNVYKETPYDYAKYLGKTELLEMLSHPGPAVQRLKESRQGRESGIQSV